MHSHICTICNRGDERTRVLQSHCEMPPAGTDRGKNKLCNNSPRKCRVSCACVFVCFCVCFCHTHELHPVLIKAGCSFYIITECGACLQQILLLSLLFAAPQSGSRHIHHPAIPSYCSPSLCNLLHAFLLLPFPPLASLLPSPIYPPCTRYDAKEVCT